MAWVRVDHTGPELVGKRVRNNRGMEGVILDGGCASTSDFLVKYDDGSYEDNAYYGLEVQI